MKSAELVLGRTFSVTFEHGKDFFTELKEFCAVNHVKQGYIPFFIAGMSEVELVGTCEKIEDKNAPIWSKVHLENVEAVDAGTPGLGFGHRADFSTYSCLYRPEDRLRLISHEPPSRCKGLIFDRNGCCRGGQAAFSAHQECITIQCRAVIIFE